MRLPAPPFALHSTPRRSRAPDASVAPRLAIVDIARGLAIVQMVVYHFCYDLNHFGWIHAALTREPGWVAWRTAIVTQFLLLVGISLVLRDAGPRAALRDPVRTPPRGVPQDPPHALLRAFLRNRFTGRWWQIAGCAALVSAGSALIFGPRWIWFGVLHFVVLAQILAAPVRRLGGANLLLGALLVGLGLTVHFPAFAHDSLSWIGFSAVKPLTEDFVPVLPWLGVVVLGIGLGNLWRRSHGPLARGLRSYRGSALGWAALVGRWPLTIYMAHQPVLFGVFTLVQTVRS